ncbi:uncharacterized protein LOC110863367 [Folsomia candida]|uniref:uncharacterized protein LOC110863367 n=1 Tax=Folsomia candida TaxID=158441 RepID=UPI000B906182|nr:uncharacterized protein LOC110863367 [Folsomia candida]
MLNVSCASINFKLKRILKIPQSAEQIQTSSSSLNTRFLFRGFPSGSDPIPPTQMRNVRNQPVLTANTVKAANRFLEGLTLDVFHSAGNPNVELRLYSDAVYPQSYCQYCNNPAIPTNSQNQNHIRLQDIRDVLICINFENKGETSAIYEVRGDPSNCPIPNPLCPCNNEKFCLRRSLCPLNIFEKYVQGPGPDGQFVSCFFERIDFCTEPHVPSAEDFEEPLALLDSMMNKKRKLSNDDKDFTLVCANTGKEFACHKFILSAHSDVFVAMFASGMQESETKTVALAGIQEATVDALLDFMYQGGLQIPFSRSDIALELLELAHQYEIQPLVNKLEQILENEDLEKISISTAIKMFSFCVKLEYADQFTLLGDKAVTIIKRNVSILEDQPDFRDLFVENPSLAKQLFVRVCMA